MDYAEQYGIGPDMQSLQERVANGNGAGGGAGGGAAGATHSVAVKSAPPQRLPFQLYYDRKDKVYKMHPPRVVVLPGTVLSVSDITCPEEVEEGVTYVCSVYASEPGGASRSYSAYVHDEGDDPASGEDDLTLVARVALFKVAGRESPSEHYFTGTLVVSGFGGEVFDPVVDPATGDVTGFSNRYYQVGGFTCTASDCSPTGSSEEVIALVIDCGDSFKSASLSSYGSMDSLTQAQDSLTEVIIPLFVLSDSRVVLDMRRMPSSGMLEYFASSQSG